MVFNAIADAKDYRDTGLPMAIVYQRLSEQVAILAKVAKDLDDVAPPPIQADTTCEQIKTLQNVDYLRQALEDLAILTSQLSAYAPQETVPTSTAVAINNKLQMATTRSVLRLQGAISSVPSSGAVSGDPLIF